MVMIPPVHPFAARMAPELALASLKRLEKGSLVLDPFAGSGTVLRHATELGHRALGFDLDPLSVLITRVWTTPVSDDSISDLARWVMSTARAMRVRDVELPWIDEDEETRRFVNFWFGRRQRGQLRRLAHVLNGFYQHTQSRKERAAANVLRIALSRTIITKDRGSSLARDVSHSRPHRVMQSSHFECFMDFPVERD